VLSVNQTPRRAGETSAPPYLPYSDERMGAGLESHTAEAAEVAALAVVPRGRDRVGARVDPRREPYAMRLPILSAK